MCAHVMRTLVSWAAGLVSVGIATYPLSGQGRLIHADGPPAWGSHVRLVPALTIGALDGPPEYAFGSVGFVVGDKNGGFFVYDEKDTQVRRYDAAGKFVAKIGAKGSGPGEYQELLGMSLLGDTALVTWDPRNARVTFFGLDGKVLRSFMPLLGSMTYAADALGVDNAGIVSLLTGHGRPVYVRYRPDGTLLDTLPAAPGAPGGLVLNTWDGSRYSFQHVAIVKPSPLGGLIVASATVLGFTMSVGGAPIAVQRANAPIRLETEERREWEAWAYYSYTWAKSHPPQPGVITSEPMLVKIPVLKPAIRGLSVDREGRVWLDVYTKAEQRAIPPRPKGDPRPLLTWRERSTFDVVSSAGVYLGRVTLPADHQLLDARGDRLWTLAKGPDDEERIEVFRISH